MEVIVEIITKGGPAALALVMAVIAIQFWKEIKKRDKIIEKMHDEKEAMYREWLEESGERNDRLASTIANNTIAITTNSQNSESVRTSLNAIMTFMAGFLERRG